MGKGKKDKPSGGKDDRDRDDGRSKGKKASTKKHTVSSSMPSVPPDAEFEGRGHYAQGLSAPQGMPPMTGLEGMPYSSSLGQPAWGQPSYPTSYYPQQPGYPATDFQSHDSAYQGNKPPSMTSLLMDSPGRLTTLIRGTTTPVRSHGTRLRTTQGRLLVQQCSNDDGNIPTPRPTSRNRAAGSGNDLEDWNHGEHPWNSQGPRGHSPGDFARGYVDPSTRSGATHTGGYIPSNLSAEITYGQDVGYPHPTGTVTSQYPPTVSLSSEDNSSHDVQIDEEDEQWQEETPTAEKNSKSRKKDKRKDKHGSSSSSKKSGR